MTTISSKTHELSLVAPTNDVIGFIANTMGEYERLVGHYGVKNAKMRITVELVAEHPPMDEIYKGLLADNLDHFGGHVIMDAESKMLLDFQIHSFELNGKPMYLTPGEQYLLHRNLCVPTPLSDAERRSVAQVYYRLSSRFGVRFPERDL